MIRALARANGMRLMHEYALEHVLQGLTTLEEVQRVVSLEQVVPINCPSCLRELSPSFVFCPYCGEKRTTQVTVCPALELAWNSLTLRRSPSAKSSAKSNCANAPASAEKPSRPVSPAARLLDQKGSEDEKD